MSTLRHVQNTKLPYETSIATASFSRTVSIYEKINAIKNAGFDSIELMEIDLPEIIDDLPHFKNTIQELGLNISIFQPFRDFEGSWLDIDERIAELEKRFKIMKILDIDLILLCSNCKEFDPKFNDEITIEQLRIASELAEKYDVKIAYEALSWGTYYQKLDQAWDIVKKVNKSNFGICLDSYHIFMKDCDIELIKEMKDKIFFVQFSDSEIGLKLPNLMFQSRSYRYLPYQGSFDNLKLLKIIEEVEYKGPLSLECFSDSFRNSTKDVINPAKESYSALFLLITELLKSKRNEVPEELFTDSEIFGFEIPDDEGSLNNNVDNIIDQVPKIKVIVDNDGEIFRRRSTILGSNSEFFSFRKIGSIGPNSDNITKDLVINCSRMAFNTLSLSLISVLQMKEDIKNRTSNNFGLSNSKTFKNGNSSITIKSLEDDQPILRNTL